MRTKECRQPLDTENNPSQTPARNGVLDPTTDLGSENHLKGPGSQFPELQKETQPPGCLDVQPCETWSREPDGSHHAGASNLQECETRVQINGCCFKLLNLWRFVTGPLEN